MAKVCVGLASVLLSLSVVEAALHCLWRPAPPESIYRRSDDPVLVYEHVPGAVSVCGGAEVRINSSGFGDDEWPAEPPTGVFRIVAIGDSVTFGWGVPFEAAFPQLLERRLAERDSPCIVYNCGVAGYATRQELRLIETRGLALRPDLILLTYVLNDPDFEGGLAPAFTSRIELLDLAKRGVRYAAEHLQGLPQEYHRKMFLRHKERIAGNFRRLGEVSRASGVPIVVVACPAFRFEPPYPWRDLHEFVGAQCEANGLPFLDLHPVFAPLDQKEHAKDVWHPSAKGHAVIADAIREFLKARRLVP